MGYVAGGPPAYLPHTHTEAYNIGTIKRNTPVIVNDITNGNEKERKSTKYYS